MDFRDYYALLGVERNASADELAKAYKRLARKFHPDLNKAAGAENKFKEINEAYEVLKNPDTRRRYDALGANWKHGAHFEPPEGFGGGSGGVHVNVGGGGFSDFFESFFGGGTPRSRSGFGRSGQGRFDSRGGSPFGGMGGQPSSRGRDIESVLTVSLDDIYHGRKRAVELSLSSGGQKKYDVGIPPTIRHGEKMRLGGQGGQGFNGQRGDLFLQIEVLPDPVFSVEGDDLVALVEVMAWDAALGGRVPVPTFEGEVVLKIPAGVASGQRLRLRERGLAKKGGGRGDLLAELRLVVPKSLSDAQRELFEQLRDQS